MEEIKSLLINNNFPPQIIDKEFERFEKYKQLNVNKVPNPEEKIKYLSLPFKLQILNNRSENATNSQRLLPEHHLKSSL